MRAAFRQIISVQGPFWCPLIRPTNRWASSCRLFRGAKETASAGVDAIILACTEALEYPLLDLLAPQGKICVFSGLPGQNPRLDLDGNAIHYKETMVVGAYGCTAGQNKQALELMASGRIKVDWLITHHVSPKDIHHGIELVKKRVGLKTIINF